MSRNNPMKKLEQRQRMSENNPMKNPKTVEKVKQKNSKKVIINGQLYESVIEAARALNKAEPTIRDWCKKGYNQNDEICYYEQDGIPINTIKINNKVSVIIDENKEFKTITEAAKYIGCSQSALSRALQNHKDCKRELVLLKRNFLDKEKIENVEKMR